METEKTTQQPDGSGIQKKSSRFPVMAILAIIVLAVVGLLAFPKAASKPGSETFELVIKNRQLPVNSRQLTARQGDDVTIKIASDEDEEFHLHGYDKAVDLQKGKTSELHFKADLSGSFPFELEHSKTDLGELQVQPR